MLKWWESGRTREGELNILSIINIFMEVKYRYKRSAQIIGYIVSQSEHTHVTTFQVKRRLRFLKTLPACGRIIPLPFPSFYVIAYTCLLCYLNGL